MPMSGPTVLERRGFDLRRVPCLNSLLANIQIRHLSVRKQICLPLSYCWGADESNDFVYDEGIIYA